MARPLLRRQDPRPTRHVLAMLLQLTRAFRCSPGSPAIATPRGRQQALRLAGPAGTLEAERPAAAVAVVVEAVRTLGEATAPISSDPEPSDPLRDASGVRRLRSPACRVVQSEASRSGGEEIERPAGRSLPLHLSAHGNNCPRHRSASKHRSLHIGLLEEREQSGRRAKAGRGGGDRMVERRRPG
eukprot:768381-Hanusia_phi.AAC.5